VLLPDASNDDGNDVDGDDGFVITLSLVTFKVMTAVLTMSFLSPHSAEAPPLVAA
jgi:hypothetical protein